MIDAARKIDGTLGAIVMTGHGTIDSFAQILETDFAERLGEEGRRLTGVIRRGSNGTQWTSDQNFRHTEEKTPFPLL